MTEILDIGDVVQVIDSPGLLDRDADFLKYLDMVGVIVDIGVSADCWIVQFDDNSEIEIPAACLFKE
jgi:hypothetical protein